MRHQRVEDLGGEAAGGAHSGEPVGPVQFDHAGAGFDPVGGGNGDIFGHRLYLGMDERGVERGWDERASIWTAALIVIGDEILSGRTQDKNVAQIASWLNVQGIRLKEVRIVADDEAAIGEAVRRAEGRATIICSPPAGSARPTTTSRSIRSRRRSACR